MCNELIPSSKVTYERDELVFERYSVEEQAKLKELKKLFCEWVDYFKCIEENESIFKDYEISHKSLSFDGFYPNYLNQKVKFLFIGRENRDLEGSNNMVALFKGIKNNVISSRTLNQSAFHRRMIYLSYAFENGKFQLNDVPYASDTIEEFTNTFSYSFMNISKFSNESGNFQSDWELINRFIDISTAERNFIFDEIEILNPDLIISMNLGKELLRKVFPNIEYIESDKEKKKDGYEEYQVDIKGNKTPVLDTYHFSYPRSDQKLFFDPIIEFAKNKRMI